MNLPQTNKRPRFLTADSAKLPQQGLSIAFYCAAGVLLGETEIECLSPINAGEPGGARAESMSQPRNARENFRTKDG